MMHMIFHFGWDKMDQSSLLTLNWTGDIVLFLFLAPEFKTKKSPIVALTLAALLTTFINIQHWLYSFLEFGHHLTKRIRFPQLEYLRFVSTGEFLKNIDPLTILVLSCAR
ncbi:GerAB/ArcD/ProY family transporter [Shimazuella sp. KC615]|uniref:GerAB/ArcD/ProY family transporter n=1 Tax=Shimazuella alba TaxID=2690964 RepID=A0A6I4VLC0_9BACL|nr:GerAB/ArcD/ProY family transporter [Shimazuella alba]